MDRVDPFQFCSAGPTISSQAVSYLDQIQISCVAMDKTVFPAPRTCVSTEKRELFEACMGTPDCGNVGPGNDVPMRFHPLLSPEQMTDARFSTEQQREQDDCESGNFILFCSYSSQVWRE